MHQSRYKHRESWMMMVWTLKWPPNSNTVAIRWPKWKPVFWNWSKAEWLWVGWYTSQLFWFFHNFLLFPWFLNLIPDFSCPTSLIDIDGTEKTWPLPKAKYEFNFPINTCGLRYEADEVRKCIHTGKLERDTISHSDSIIIAHIQTEIRKQIGVEYPADDEDWLKSFDESNFVWKRIILWLFFIKRNVKNKIDFDFCRT